MLYEICISRLFAKEHNRCKDSLTTVSWDDKMTELWTCWWEGALGSPISQLLPPSGTVINMRSGQLRLFLGDLCKPPRVAIWISPNSVLREDEVLTAERTPEC